MEAIVDMDATQAELHSAAQAKIASVTSAVGREIRVFVRPAAVPTRDEESEAPPATSRAEESEDFYEFTLEDYARTRQAKKGEEQLKTKKIRDEEAAARQSRISKAVVRVQFPDGWVVESSYLPSDSVSQLRKVVEAVVKAPETPFYFYTAPPKQRIRDEAQSLYSAGLAPGALIYFAQEREGGSNPGPEEMSESSYLLPSVSALKDLHLVPPPTPSEAPSAAAGLEEKGAVEVKASEPALKPQPSEKPKSVGKPKWLRR